MEETISSGAVKISFDVDFWNVNLTQDIKLQFDGLTDEFHYNSNESRLFLVGSLPFFPSFVKDYIKNFESKKADVNVHPNLAKFEHFTPLRELMMPSNSTILFWDEMQGRKGFFSRSTNALMDGMTTAFAYTCHFTNSFETLKVYAGSDRFGAISIIDSDDIVSLKEQKSGYFSYLDEDQITGTPIEMDDIPVSVCIVKASIRLSEYYEKKIIEAIRLFPNQKLSLSFLCEPRKISHQMAADRITVQGVHSVIDEQINVTVARSSGDLNLRSTKITELPI